MFVLLQGLTFTHVNPPNVGKFQLWRVRQPLPWANFAELYINNNSCAMQHYETTTPISTPWTQCLVIRLRTINVTQHMSLWNEHSSMLVILLACRLNWWRQLLYMIMWQCQVPCPLYLCIWLLSKVIHITLDYTLDIGLYTFYTIHF